MYASTKNRAKPPLNEERLRNLALHYAGRYATTRAKLSRYLTRKLAERGWDGEQRADIETLVQQFAELEYVNDAHFAEALARSFIQRGYGQRRLNQDLHAAGIAEADASEAQDNMAESRFTAAANFARRKRIGPFASTAAPPELRQKQLAAFLRAGHDFALAKRFVYAAPGEDVMGD